MANPENKTNAVKFTPEEAGRVRADALKATAGVTTGGEFHPKNAAQATIFNRAEALKAGAEARRTAPRRVR